MQAGASLIDKLAALSDDTAMRAITEFERMNLASVRDAVGYFIGIVKRIAVSMPCAYDFVQNFSLTSSKVQLHFGKLASSPGSHVGASLRLPASSARGSADHPKLLCSLELLHVCASWHHGRIWEAVLLAWFM